MGNIILDALRPAPAPTLYDGAHTDPPKDHDRRRGLVDLRGTIEPDDRPILTIDQARQEIRDRMSEYLAMPDPAHILLIAAPPGSGKTTEAVRQAEAAARAGQRVLFAGARHNMWDDLMAASTLSERAKANYWYHWLPITSGDAETGAGQTCRYARQLGAWVERGHQSLDFCSNPRICGFTYMNQSCVYRRQKEQKQPILFIQHDHITLQHPLWERAGILFGDESPLNAFLHPRTVAPRDIVPSDLTDYTIDARPNTDLIELLQLLRAACDRPTPLDARTKAPTPAWEGPELLDLLGGAERVLEICTEHATIDAGSKALAPVIYAPDQAESVPCWYLGDLLPILEAEAIEALAGRPYIRRARVGREGLTLLLRRAHQPLPPHVIWMDATANVELYKTLFGRSIELVAPRVQMAGAVKQVYARLNNKDRLVGGGDGRIDRAAERRLVDAQVRQIVRAGGYRAPAVVSFKAIANDFGHAAAHFGGLRGTNRLRDCDALIVVGTPQASLTTLRDQAAMLLRERIIPFDLTWSDRTIPYRGHAYGYDVSGFWHDSVLQALLMETREAELVQAAHRVRPLFRPVDVWLLTNVPLRDLPPDELLSLVDLFQSPKGVDPYGWPAVLDLLDAAGDDGLSAQQLQDALKLPDRTAERWFAALCAYPGIVVRRRTGGRGPSRRVCVKGFSDELPPRGYK